MSPAERRCRPLARHVAPPVSAPGRLTPSRRTQPADQHACSRTNVGALRDTCRCRSAAAGFFKVMLCRSTPSEAAGCRRCAVGTVSPGRSGRRHHSQISVATPREEPAARLGAAPALAPARSHYALTLTQHRRLASRRPVPQLVSAGHRPRSQPERKSSTQTRHLSLNNRVTPRA